MRNQQQSNVPDFARKLEAPSQPLPTSQGVWGSPGRQTVLPRFKYSGWPLLTLQWCFYYWRQANCWLLPKLLTLG